MEETGGASAYGASLAGGGFDFFKFIRQPQTIVRLLSWVSAAWTDGAGVLTKWSRGVIIQRGLIIIATGACVNQRPFICVCGLMTLWNNSPLWAASPRGVMLPAAGVWQQLGDSTGQHCCCQRTKDRKVPDTQWGLHFCWQNTILTWQWALWSVTLQLEQLTITGWYYNSHKVRS